MVIGTFGTNRVIMAQHENILDCAQQLGLVALKRGRTCVTAESCTGGLIAAAITDIAGSSNWFDRGFVTYSNTAKAKMLNVNIQTIALNGAVSEPVVEEMAAGAIENSNADLSVAVSGVAGPGGGTVEKPVGTVCFGWACNLEQKVWTQTCHYNGSRRQIRLSACENALLGLIAILNVKMGEFIWR